MHLPDNSDSSDQLSELHSLMCTWILVPKPTLDDGKHQSAIHDELKNKLIGLLDTLT